MINLGCGFVFSVPSIKVGLKYGQLVELMICDLKSYIPAMYYMLAFNHKNDIITYWVEPTIRLDYEDHPCHEIIHRNWSENIIPNIILCSATLPSQDEIADTIENYKEKFEGEIYSIKSNNYNKSISLINKEGKEFARVIGEIDFFDDSFKKFLEQYF